VAFMFLLN